MKILDKLILSMSGLSALFMMIPAFSSCTAPMTENKADQLVEEEVSAFLASQKEVLKPMLDNKVFTFEGTKMPVKIKVFGEEPADGRSLYISMHGGGAAPVELNNGQWENQIRLYRPAEGVYIAPRAPFDDWNMWFRPQIDPLFEQLILSTVIEMNVNPDKVYLLGYSAGGDGVWRMAPRMGDRWAAASMMAGHPGEASLLNLRNVPFMIWMGENDAAYNRNGLAAVKGHEMDSLQQADPAGYIHETHIVEGKGHWMDHVDTLAVSWMPQYRRNPFPDKIVWRQEEVCRPSFYWLEVDPAEMAHQKTIRASYEGNVFEIEQSDYHQVTLCLNDEFVNLDEPVIVHYQGKEIFNGKVERTREAIRHSLELRKDPRLVFTAQLTLDLE